MPPPDVTDLAIKVAEQTVRVESLIEKVDDYIGRAESCNSRLEAQNGKLEKRIESLEDWRTASEASEKAVKETAQDQARRTATVWGLAIGTGSFLLTLIMDLWVRFKAGGG